MYIRLKNKFVFGFTIIELMVVLVIIAILATIAVPMYINTVERSRAGEAVANLQIIRMGLKNYKLEKGEYPTSIADADINDTLNLDIDKKFFTYSTAKGVSTATRKDDAPSDFKGKELVLKEDGSWKSGNVWGI